MRRLEVRSGDDLSEWGTPAPAGFSSVEWLWLALVVGVPGVTLVLAAGLIAGAAVAAIAALVYCGLVWWWLSRQNRAALAAVGGGLTLEAKDAPRLFNLATGIAAELGLGPPRLLLWPAEEVNAFACRAGGPVIVVSRAVLENYTRTELEAVVAHSLIRLSAGDRHRAVVAAALGGLAGPAGVARHDDDDLRTIAFTRYPPALASAIAKASPVGGSRASYWFVPAASGDASQAQRVRRLRDL